jgi:uncharacterized RDD family membrane protein YckC
MTMQPASGFVQPEPQPSSETMPPPATAGVGLRFVAVLIDIILLGAVGWAWAALLGRTTSDGFELSGLPAFALIAAAAVYYIVAEARVGGTVGKFAVGLRVTLEDGSTPGWRASMIRNLLRVVDGFAFFLVGAIFIWTSPRRQRLGDRVAGTLVVVLRR